MAKLSLVLLLWCLSAVSLAQTQQPQQTQEMDEQTAQAGLNMLADLPLGNQIPLLDNRFRIDDGIESITMVLFRRRGTASIVLVRPDGSKVFYNTAKDNGMRWHDAATYDLIEISNPMPGPWQAIGRILPDSKILVLTDVELKVDVLPEPLMVGETFKLTARLMDGERTVDVREFKDILNLQVHFVSTNNKEYDNFGRGIVDVATFRDDGRGYDASARDGIFTGEINLAFGAGEWTPKYSVTTPLYSREIEQAPVIIAPAPVALKIEAGTTTPEGQPQHHRVLFEPVSELVDPASLLFQGQIRYPDGDMQPFALTEPSQSREVAMENRGPGSYILNVAVFGQMLDGREFVLNLPEERFLVTVQAQEAPALPEPVIVEPSAEPVAADEPEALTFPWRWVIGVNLIILLTGGMAIWLVFTGRGFAALLFWRKKKTPEEIPASNPQDKTEPKKAQKNTDSDDILDLSLPDD